MAWEVNVKSNLRPCYIVWKGSKTKALFHSWSFTSDIYNPSVMIGGHPGAIVELEDGSVTIVRPKSIRFVPGIFDEYEWGEQDAN